MKYFTLLLVVGILFGCSFSNVTPEEIAAAQSAYDDASASIDTAAGRQLDVTGATDELRNARVQLDEENYSVSMAHSKSAKQLADDLISEDDRRQAEIQQQEQRQRLIEQQAMAEKKRAESARMAGYEHVVVPGDTLWSIARNSSDMKNPLLWPVIYKNNTVIRNPDMIAVGQKLKIRQPSTDESSAAIRYSAKRLKTSKDNQQSLDDSYRNSTTGL